MRDNVLGEVAAAAGNRGLDEAKGGEAQGPEAKPAQPEARMESEGAEERPECFSVFVSWSKREDGQPEEVNGGQAKANGIEQTHSECAGWGRASAGGEDVQEQMGQEQQAEGNCDCIVQSLSEHFVHENWQENEQRKGGEEVAESGQPTGPGRCGPKEQAK